MIPNHDYHSDTQRRLEEGLEESVQRYEARLVEAERAGVNAHRVQTRGIGKVRNWLLAVFTVAVVVGVMVAAYILASGSATEEPPFLQCETQENCPTPLE
ncbi:MAG: hypothetical protein OXI33_04975 [Chloroflexota bacterium]|nr:hypothetical protein [Chloroflexota bacterium]